MFSKFFYFCLGWGKQFIGEGYCLMFILDNSVNYFFFRIEMIIGKLCYVNFWLVMNDICLEVELVDEVFVCKYFFMYYLSLNIGQWLNVGFFEGIMWGDELNCYGFDVNFFNLVIFYCLVEFFIGVSGGNILMGINMSYCLGKGLKLYGQVVIDEFIFFEIWDWSNGFW